MPRPLAFLMPRLLVCLALGIAFLAACPVARADPMMPTLIIDAVSGDVLHADEATRPWFPASTTKLMTAYVALRAVKSGQVSFDTPLTVSPFAAKQPPSKIGVKAGQELTLENALKILMVKSANDVAVVVAEGVGGSVPTFADMMNREAARLGMRESHFVNPHGWHDERQTISARDLAILARALWTEFPEYRELFSIGAIQMGKRIYRNTNGLVGRYSGAVGMKTGFVCASGFNLVGAAQRNGRTLIAVVLGAGTGGERTLKAAQLLDRGFDSGGGFWGNSSSGRTLAALTSSIETAAPNRRADICGKRRGPLGEDDESVAAAASTTTSGGDGAAIMRAGLMAAPQASSVGVRQQGRIELGPRAEVEPEIVYIGRKPGSNAIARLPDSMNKTGAIQNVQAFAPPTQPRAAGGPLVLPGAITGAGAAAKIGTAKAAPPRPAAAASLANRGVVGAPLPPKAPADTKTADTKTLEAKAELNKKKVDAAKKTASAAKTPPNKAKRGPKPVEPPKSRPAP